MTQSILEERKKQLLKKQKVLQSKIKAMDSRSKVLDRKARTKRLIESGAIVEKYLGVEGPIAAEKILSYLSNMKVEGGKNPIEFVRLKIGILSEPGVSNEQPKSQPA